MDKKFTKHQQKIIKNYYENRDAISLQRLSELVTELYLATGKGRERQWKYIVGTLEKLGLPQERIEHLRQQDNPALLAKLVEELMAKQS
jgi:acetylornithine deacetylase/succinyl-diaminopimelate desuccinylase-like protein